MGKTPTLAQWEHLRLRTVVLSSTVGTKNEFTVEVEPADLTDLLYGDPEAGIEAMVPNELAPIAEKVEYEGIGPDDLKKLTKEERIQLTRFRHWLIANRVKSPKLTIKDVRKLPYEDQIQLFRVCTHTDLAERVMLASFREVPAGNERNGSRPDAEGTAE